MRSKLSTLLHTWIGILIYLFLGINNVFSVSVEIPGNENVYRDVNVPLASSTDVITWEQWDIIDLIKLINNYLWMSLGVLCLATTVYGWFLLITAQWDKSKMQKANQILLWSGIWIIICVMAYVLVRVVVNLF